MADSAYKNAVALQAELQNHVRALDEQLAALEGERQHVMQSLSAVADFISLHDQYAALQITGVSESDDGVQSKVVPPPPPPTSSHGKSRNPPHQIVAKAAAKIIEHYGQPMKKDLLHQCLMADGLHVTGKDDYATLATMLWRHKDQIVLLKGHGYWLANSDYEPAGYKAFDVFN